MRWWGFIALLIIAGGAGTTLWLWIPLGVRSAVQASASALDLDLGAQHALDVDVLGAQLAARSIDLQFLNYEAKERRPLLQMPLAQFDVAVLETLNTGAVIINDLSANNVTLGGEVRPDPELARPVADEPVVEDSAGDWGDIFGDEWGSLEERIENAYETWEIWYERYQWYRMER